MALDAKYDTFYQSSGPRQRLPDIRFSGWPRDRMQAVLAVPLRGNSILDIGCGDGRLLYQFRDRFKQLIGLEYSVGRLEVAKQNLAECHFQGFCGSAEAMTDIASDSIDCIVSADVIEHIPDVYVAVDEMFRVLRPGGLMVINTPNIAFAVKRIRLLLGRFPSTSQPNEGLGSDVLFDGGHLHYFTYRSLRLLLQRPGFRIERAIGFGKLGKVHDVWRSLTSVGVQWVVRKPG